MPESFATFHVELPYYLKVRNFDKNRDAFDCQAIGQAQDNNIWVSKSLIEGHSLKLETTEERYLSMTALANEFVAIPKGRLMKVCFTKTTGEERVLTGYKVNLEGNNLGQSTVIDIEIESGSPIRVVDHRKIKWFVEASKEPVKFVRSKH